MLFVSRTSSQEIHPDKQKTVEKLKGSCDKRPGEKPGTEGGLLGKKTWSCLGATKKQTLEDDHLAKKKNHNSACSDTDKNAPCEPEVVCS